MFIYINDNFLHAPSTDLSREVVKVLVTLMEAQGTEIFLENMAQVGENGKGAALRAKVSITASSLYAGIIEECKEWVTKDVFIKEWSLLVQVRLVILLPFSILTVCQVKAKYFASRAQYDRSSADAATSKYGDALARLHLTAILAKEAHKLSLAFSSAFVLATASTSLPADAATAMVEITKTHLALVEEVLKRAEKDNDLIYHASITSTASLPNIDKISVATPIPIGDVYATEEVQKLVGPDLFAKLVPMGVIEGSSVYDEMKAGLVRGESEKCELAEGERIAALDYLGLPAALEKFKSVGAGLESLTDPGKDARAWSEELRSAENSREGRTEDLLRKLVTIKSTTSNTLNKTPMLLEQESADCEAKRKQFGNFWEQPPSANFTRTYRSDLRSHKESFEQAARSDEQVMQIWEGIKNDVAILVEGGERLEAMFVEGVAGGVSRREINLLDDGDLGEDQQENAETEEIRRKVEKIQDGLSRLHAVKRERLEVLKDLKERVRFINFILAFFLTWCIRRFKPTTFLDSSSSIARDQHRSIKRYSTRNWRNSVPTNLESSRQCNINQHSSPPSLPTTRLSQKVLPVERSKRNSRKARKGGKLFSRD